MLGQAKKITDICLLVEDIERTVDFYVNKLGFKLRRRAESFADFSNGGVTLAAWELDHINRHTGVSNKRAPAGAHKACVAMELDRPEEIDRLFTDLSAKGVSFMLRAFYRRVLPARRGRRRRRRWRAPPG